jgi:hypothetical protein
VAFQLGEPKLLIYVIGLAFAGVAGVLQFSYLTVGDPTTRKRVELAVIAAVVIGGASLNGRRRRSSGDDRRSTYHDGSRERLHKDESRQLVQEIVAVVLDRLRHRGTGST